jgi:hypothetical protein
MGTRFGKNKHHRRYGDRRSEIKGISRAWVVYRDVYQRLDKQHRQHLEAAQDDEWGREGHEVCSWGTFWTRTSS